MPSCCKLFMILQGAVHYGVVLMCNKDAIYVKQPICAEGKRCRLQGQKV